MNQGLLQKKAAFFKKTFFLLIKEFLVVSFSSSTHTALSFSQSSRFPCSFKDENFLRKYRSQKF